MAEELTLWAVYTNDDLTEGRGRQFVKHFCKTQATAVRLAKRGYVQGTDCPVEPVKAIMVEGKYFLPTSMLNIVPPTKEDEDQQRRIDDQKRALEKAKALGLSDDEIAALSKIRGGE